MKVTCPHSHEFEILSNEGLIELGITPNVRARAAERGEFPQPWVEFPNRHVWLKEEVLDYLTSQSLRETERVVDPMLDRLMRLPEERRDEALEALREKLNTLQDGTQRKKR